MIREVLTRFELPHNIVVGGSPRAVSLIVFAMIRSTAEISPFDIPHSRQLATAV
jgi:hypothetical protein